MKAVIIDRKLSKKDIVSINDLLHTGQYKVICINNQDCFLFDKKVICKTDIKPNIKKEINYNSLKEIINFGEKKLNHTSITDLLAFENFHYWYYFKHRIYFSLRNTLYIKSLIESIYNNYNKIIYYGSKDLTTVLNDSESKITVVNIENKVNLLDNFRSLIKFSLLFFIRSFIGTLQYVLNSGIKHIIIDHAKKQLVIHPETFKPYKENSHLAYLFCKIKKRKYYVRLVNTDFPKPNVKYQDHTILKNYFRFKGNLFGDFIISRGLLNYGILKTLKKQSFLYKKNLDLINSHCVTSEEKYIINQLYNLAISSNLYLLKYLAYKRYFKSKRFLSILSIDENSPMNRSILDAARNSGINTFAMQHGNIYDLHAAYMYSENDKNRDIFCSMTFLWGEYWKTLLSDYGNYPNEHLTITGQIRTDIIPLLKKNKNKTTKLLPEALRNRNIIVYASQPQRDPEQRRQSAYDVFYALKHFPDTLLICKLHPNEKNDFQYYHTIAKEAGCTNYMIIYDIDLYLLLSQSIIVVTCFSTVGTEAVYFEKPLIIWDPLGQDLQNYHKEKVALTAKNANDIKFYISKLLRSENLIQKKDQIRFINKYAYKIDGHASDRVLSMIEKRS